MDRGSGEADSAPSGAGPEAGGVTPVRLRVDLAYLGDHFHGWQEQRGDLPTVQGALRGAIARLGDEPVEIAVAGRTDAGVHARGQVCHLGVGDLRTAQRIARALPGLVPAGIQIHGVRRVSPDFHARFSATARRYSYHLLLRRDLFRPHTWQLKRSLDRDAMDAAAACLLGTRDFSSFCKKASLKDNSNDCSVDLCFFHWCADSAIFHVRANRFLHNMVRNLVGTLEEVGRGLRAPEDIAGILDARDRQRAGRAAPACGLFLEEVSYPPALDDPEYRDQGDNS